MVRVLKKRRKSWFSYLVVLMVLFTCFQGGYLTEVYAKESKDVTSILENRTVSVKQGSEVVETNGTLDPYEDILFNISFDVPVIGDKDVDAFDESSYVQSSDTATFPLPDTLDINTSTASAIDLMFEGVTVGALSFSGGNAVVTFTDLVDDPSVSEVFVSFDVLMSYNMYGDGVEQGDYIIEILGKSYTLTVPEREVSLTGQKTGIIIDDNIRWMVKIQGTYEDNGDEAPLSGYEFYDDLTDVGEYVKGSLRIGTTSDYMTATAITVTSSAVTTASSMAVYNVDDELTYNFSQDAEGTRYIFFETVMDEDILYSSTEVDINNEAIITEMDVLVTTLSGIATYTPEWITKSGSVIKDTEWNEDVYLTDNRQIEWVIEANQNAMILNEAVITDVIPDGMTWVSAEFEKYDADVAGWVTDSAITFDQEPINGEYTIGNINSMVRITIVANVDSNDEPTTITNYKNTASISWKSSEGEGVSANSNTPSIGVGFKPLSKSVGAYDASTHRLKWTVNLDTKSLTYGGNLRVIDLIVYGTSFDVQDIDTISNNEFENLKEITISAIEALTPRYNQAVVDGTITSSTGTSVTKHDLVNEDGKLIATVLVMTAEDGTGLDVTTIHSMSYETVITNPDIYASNETSNVKNSVSLFSGDTKVTTVTRGKNVTSNMLRKDYLTRENAGAYETAVTEDITTGLASLNGDSAGAYAGYDYSDNDVYYRIHVNANGLTDATGDLSSIDGESLGNFIIRDILPQGWEFKQINGNDFLLYEATLKSGSSNVLDAEALVTTTASILTEESGLPIAPTADKGGEISFEFESLTKPYIIVVKAGPTSDTIDGYFDANQTIIATNNVTLTNSSISVEVSDYEDVTIVSEVIEKTADLSKADDEAYITWEVVYNPYERVNEGAYIEDILPIGLDLRTDATGELVLDGNIMLYEMALSNDGSLLEGSQVELSGSAIMTYDTETRVLHFDIPDTSQAYKLFYVTDITGMPGEVTNTVKLYSFSESGNTSSGTYSISHLNYNTSFTRSGWIKINKEDGNGGQLAGVEFTLYAEDGSTIIRQVTTNDQGIAYIKVIPEGNYILKETETLEGYTILETDYQVAVMNDEGSFTTSINGGEETASNEITLKNYLAGTVGNLTIEKKVTGNRGDAEKPFNFTFILEENTDTFNYIGNGVSNGAITSGDSFSLQHGQSITIYGIPMDTAYTITEEDYSSDGYTTTANYDTGSIVVDDTVEVLFVNRNQYNDDDEETTEEEEESDEQIIYEEVEPSDDDEDEDEEEIEDILDDGIPEEIIYKPTQEIVEVEIIKEPEDGTLEVEEDGTIIYTPDDDFDGIDQFIIIITNPDGEEEEITIDIIEELPEGIFDMPETGGLPIEILTGFGLGIIAIGFWFKRK